MAGLRIGIVCYPSYGGSGIVGTELARQLARRGHRVHLVSYDMPVRLGGDDGVVFHEIEVPQYPLFKYPPYLLALANKLVELARYERLDVIHAHYAIPHATAAVLAREILGGWPPVLTTLHGTDITLLGSDPSFFDVIRFSMERSDALTAVSDALRDETVQAFRLERPVETVYNFIDPDLRCRVPGVPRESPEPVLIHVSNFRPVKRVPLVVEIFARVNAEHPARLWLVGDGPDSAEAHRRAERLGVADRVVFWGMQQRVEPLLSAADVLLLPSTHESFGLAALEAMACEVPVVATSVGGVPEVVVHGVTGLLYEPDDLDGMVEGCLRLLADADLRRVMGRAGRERAAAEFAADRIVPQYEAIYRRLVEARA